MCELQYNMYYNNGVLNCANMKFHTFNFAGSRILDSFGGLCGSIRGLFWTFGVFLGPSGDFILFIFIFLGPSEDFLVPSEDFLCPSEEFLCPSEEFLGPSEDFLGPSEDFLCSSGDFLRPSRDFLCSSGFFLGVWGLFRFFGDFLGSSEDF